MTTYIESRVVGGPKIDDEIITLPPLMRKSIYVTPTKGQLQSHSLFSSWLCSYGNIRYYARSSPGLSNYAHCVVRTTLCNIMVQLIPHLIL